MKRHIYISLSLGLALMVAFGACAPLAGGSRPGHGVTVRMAQATWDTGWFQAQVYCSSTLTQQGLGVTEDIIGDDWPTGRINSKLLAWNTY